MGTVVQRFLTEGTIFQSGAEKMGRTLILLLQLLSLAAAASNLSSCGCQQELTGLEAKILKMEAKILKMEAEFTRQIENLKAVISLMQPLRLQHQPPAELRVTTIQQIGLLVTWL